MNYMRDVPEGRIRTGNDRAPQPAGSFVLYWMTATRRPGWNFGLQRAAGWARDLGKPLLVLEAIGCRHRWASDRFHAMILEGMVDNHWALKKAGAGYYGYIEPTPGAGKGLLEALASRSCVVVTDDFPCFFLPRIAAAAAAQCPVRFELVDSNGLFPMHATDRVFTTAHSFRRFLQRALPEHLDELPEPDPVSMIDLPPPPEIPVDVAQRWLPIPDDLEIDSVLADLPIDHGVSRVAGVTGGTTAARRRLHGFVEAQLGKYDTDRNTPDEHATSRLSPYLHFGHISSYEILTAIAEAEGWSPDQLASTADGKRAGWWGMSPSAEAFLDQVVTWRELGFNMCSHRDDYDQYETLPDFARKTLREHAHDERPHLYGLPQLEAAETHDELWNAAQRELVRTGTIHNYLRMLWGKKILEWSESPRIALDVMVELNNKYALDGRNPNSYSGIMWCLGRYDRAWGPERPIFGKIRYMSSANAARKLKLRGYLARFTETPLE